MSGILKKRRPSVGINIVPLVDVLIVLIFFFLMTMQFRNLNVLNITPPEVETAGKNQAAEQVLVGVDTEGKFYFNNEMVTEAELKDALSLAGQSNPRQTVLVIADQDSALKNTTTVMDASRKAGLEKVKLQVK